MQELCPTSLPPDFRMYYGLRGDDGMGDGWGWVGMGGDVHDFHSALVKLKTWIV